MRASKPNATRLLNRQLVKATRQHLAFILQAPSRFLLLRVKHGVFGLDFGVVKKFTNKNLSRGGFLPHVVGPQGSCRNNLLFAVVHRLLPWLFTAVRMYSQS